MAALPTTSGIYRITHVASGKFYIGSAVNLRKRCYRHRWQLSRGSHDNQKLQRAWVKYGAEAFLFSVQEHVECVERLIEREQYWIDSLDAVAKGYNLCPVAGSVLGIKRTEETRKLMSANAKERGISPENRLKMSLANRGHKQTPEHIAKCVAHRIGKPLSEETKRKISEANKGKKRDAKAVERHRIAITGRKQSPETIAKKVASMVGGKRSDAARANMSAAQKGRVISQETREKLRIVNLGKKQSIETVEKRRQTISAFSLERQKLKSERLSLAGRGRKMSPESTAKAWETRRRNRAAQQATTTGGFFVGESKFLR